MKIVKYKQTYSKSPLYLRHVHIQSSEGIQNSYCFAIQQVRDDLIMNLREAEAIWDQHLNKHINY